MSYPDSKSKCSVDTKLSIEEGKKQIKEKIHYKKPSIKQLAAFIDYIPTTLGNIITTSEIIESCFEEKLVHLFQKCLLESDYTQIVEGIPGGTKGSNEMLDFVKNKFVFSNNLNPYEYVTSVLEDSDYFGEFYLTNKNKMLFIPKIREKKKGFINPVIGPDTPENSREKFARSLDGFHFVLFLNRFQTFVGSETQPQIISLQHLKNIALFTCLLDLPMTFIEFLFEETVDDFLRALAVYFQYYLQLWDALTIRSEIKKTKLHNPQSIVIENQWQQNLNDLRFFVARNYIIMILGANKNMQNYHHLNRKFCISGNDIVNYELLYHFSAQIMLMIFNHENDERKRQIILDQVDKLFKYPIAGYKDPYDCLSSSDRAVLEGEFHKPFAWDVCSPCLLEIKRPGRDLKLLHTGKNIIITKNKRLRLLQSALLVSEDKMEEANIKLGILGKPRADYPSLLNCTKITFKERNEGLAEKKVDSSFLRGGDTEGGGMGWTSPVLVRKEFRDKAYNTEYSLLYRRKENRKQVIHQWKRYAHASDRFWYRIDPHFTVVDSFKEKYLEIFQESCRHKAQFERRIKSLVQKIRRD